MAYIIKPIASTLGMPSNEMSIVRKDLAHDVATSFAAIEDR